MSVEVVLFVIVGTIAVLAAAGMLWSKDAVSSALCLILNFICVAFLYVMLDASFLAVVQVAVYAGAIMVLFLFVIMLLNAEKVVTGAKRFAWLPGSVLALALVFLITISAALIAGKIDDQEQPDPQPRLRIVLVAPDVGVVDVYLDETQFATALDFTQRDHLAGDFVAVTPGEHTLALTREGNPTLLPLGAVTLESGRTYTVILYGEQMPVWAVIEEDLSTIRAREARVTVFNAYLPAAAVNLVDTGGDFAFADEADAAAAEVVIANLAAGQAATTFLEKIGAPTWAFVPADDPDAIMERLENLTIERNTVNLIILAGERNTIESTLDPVFVPVSAPNDLRFGTPEALGAALFVDYALPFEMVAILLLAAMIGVIVLTHRVEPKPKPGRALRRKVSRPLVEVIAAQIGQSKEKGE